MNYSNIEIDRKIMAKYNYALSVLETQVNIMINEFYLKHD